MTSIQFRGHEQGAVCGHTPFFFDKFSMAQGKSEQGLNSAYYRIRECGQTSRKSKTNKTEEHGGGDVQSSFRNNAR